MGKWYEPPISMDGLARSSRASVHHASAMIVKRNILAACLSRRRCCRVPIFWPLRTSS